MKPGNSHNLKRGRILGLTVLLLLMTAVPVYSRPAEDNVRQYIERTEELLLWAQELVVETESDPARRVLRQAAELHQRSQGLFGRGKMIESLAVARRARDAMWHAVRVAREAMGLEERVRIRAERFRDQQGHLLERAREFRNQNALDFLERARRQADRARDMYRQGDFKLSWKLLEQAGDLMQRAARLLADGGGPERLERELDRARQAVERARDRLAEADGTGQHQIFVEAEEALQRASQAHDQGQSGRALQMAGLATSLARRVGRANVADVDNDAIQRQLDRFAERAEKVGAKVKAADSGPARRAFDRALHQRDLADTAHRKGESERALRQIRAAHDLLNQAESLLR